MKRIVIFDDDTDILEILTYLLQEKGWEVYTQTTCKHVTKVVAAHRPNVVLMDNWIPEAGGVKATQTLKSDPALSSIPVIYFSANNNIAQLAEEAGADAYLAKPFDLDYLETILSKFS
ncbi:response regulator [Pedobacter sp. SYSU D00535]|uniref:response regulator n=1 Tax=Pedobacter sp. SYSU D00535 TaxID=2810308 RepID=UPI00351B08FE